MDVIQEIKDRLNIVDVVSKYVELKQSGSTYKARCPFHKESTASFHVFPNTGTWHCFGACGIGGDIFSFTEKVRGVDFKEALRLLAEQANVTLPKKEERRDTNILYEINEVAAKCYMENLKGAPLDYLYERGFSNEILSRFKIGLSPTEEDRLYQYLLRQGFKTEDISKAGLIIKEKKVRDFFRNRIMFPIKSETGHILGFAGRALESKSKQKYLNTPETSIFSKKSVLWGLDMARESIRQEKCIVLVEGYTDVMMAHQYGFLNTVAICGSSLTPEHIITIRKYTTNILMALDPDNAGEQATLRGIKIAKNAFDGHTPAPDFINGDSSQRGEIKIIELPPGIDPDECIKNSPAEWLLHMVEARPVMDFLFDAILSRLDISREVGKASAAEQLIPIIKEIKDPVEQELYMDKLATSIGMAPAVLRNKDYGKPVSRKTQKIIAENINTAEEYCLALILKYGRKPGMSDLVDKLTPEHFAKLENREVFKVWRAETEFASAHLKGYCDTLLSRQILFAGVGSFVDCVKFLERERIKRQQEMLLVLLANANNEEERLKILEQLQHLRS